MSDNQRLAKKIEDCLEVAMQDLEERLDDIRQDLGLTDSEMATGILLSYGLPDLQDLWQDFVLGGDR